MSGGDTLLETAAGTEPAEPIVLGDVTSRKLRHTLQRNNMERTMCQRQTRHLDSQRKNIRCKIDREERELRHQLHRLHEEQKVLTRLDSLQDEYILQGTSHTDIPTCSTEDVTSVTEPEADVINPYPVALRRHAPPGEEKGDSGSATPDVAAFRSYHGRRRVSVEFEDLELQTSTGKIFPPLQGSSRHPLALGLHASVSMLTLVSEGGTSGSTSGSPRDKERAFLWAGTPEAIQSVRRPRKSVSRQRLENLMAKAATYKEHSGSKGAGSSMGAGSDLHVRENLRRCSSLKESRRRGSGRLHSATYGGSGGCSRSNSWKEGRGRRALLSAESTETMYEAFTHLDIGGGHSSATGGDRSSCSKRYGGRTPLLSRQSSISSLRDYTATPETKSCVWGTVTCLDLSPDGAPADGATSSLLLRRHGRKKNQPDAPSLPMISAPTEGATAAKPPVSSPLAATPRGAERGATPRYMSRSREGSLKKKT